MRSVLAASGLMLASVLGHAAELTPDATVRKAYEVTQKTLDGSGQPPWRPPHRDTLMSRSLAALFARDDLFQDESGDIGHVGADPFITARMANSRICRSASPASPRADGPESSLPSAASGRRWLSGS